MVKTFHPWMHKPGFRLGASTDSKSKNGAASRGIAYHKRVYRKLSSLQTPDTHLLIEPWFQKLDQKPQRTMRSPDGVLLYPYEQLAVVIEVKMNWADGRDEKLLTEYLPIVKSAFRLDTVWPLLITGCLRGYEHPPLLGLQQFEKCMEWEPGRPTPLMLLP